MSNGRPGIDWEQLDMIADGYTDDFVEIYREFELDLPRILREVDSAQQQGNATAMARAAHQAKGSAANFGFVGFSALMAQIEQLGKSGSTDGAAALLAEAQVAFQEAVESVRAERNI